MPTLAPLNEVTEIMQGIWDSGVMTHNGPLVQKFEKEVAAHLDTKNIVSCVNGTIAIQMAIKALELKGEIITTPFTFIATLSAIKWEGCTPVFVDIDPDTLNIDPTKIEDAITDKTVAILPVHVFGNTCDTDAIDEIAKRHNLKVIYDAAHSVGVRHKGKCIFEYGDISTTSFHATKMLNTSEGGGCFTTDKALHEKMKRIRFFGFDDAKEVVEDGTNAKMTEVNAAIGLANIKYLQEALADRKEKYELYKSLLSKRDDLSFQKITDSCNYSYFPVIFETEEQLLQVEKALAEEHIFARRYFYPAVNTFTDIVDYVEMPCSESIASRILCLPLYYNLEIKDIERVVKLII